MVIEDRRQIIYVSGSLRSNQWPVIRTTAHLVFEHYPLGIAIDFSGVRWVSAAGEATIVAAMNEIDDHNLPFALLNFSSVVEPLISHSVSQRLARGTEVWWNRLCGTG